VTGKDRLPIASVPIRYAWRIFIYCLFAVALPIAVAFTADSLSPLTLSLGLAAFLIILGVFLFVPKRWQLKAYAEWRDVMPCHLSVQNRDLRIIDANDIFRRDFGDRKGEYCYKVYKQTDKPCVDCPVLKTFKDGRVHTTEETVLTNSGETRDVLVTSAPLLDGNDNVTSVVELFTDITESSLLHKELDKSRRDYKQLFEIVPCYICTLNKDFEIIEANTLYREHFDFDRGIHCYEICKQRSSSCPNCLAQAAFNDGLLHTAEETLTTKNGDKLKLVVHVLPIRNDLGEITSAMEVFTDITEIKRLQEELTSMGRAVAGMAHRIKNILMGLEGGIFVVNTGMELNDKQMLKEGWEMVERNVGRVSQLVKDLLYCSKERAPRFKENVCPQEIATEITRLFSNTFKEASIDVKLDFQQPPIRGIFDPDGIYNMLNNLVGNAIDACRFDLNENKKRHLITIKCASGEDNSLVIEVSDNGPGIPADVRERVFEDFFSTKGTEGTGMGLLVVKKVAAEHGGDVTLSTETDQGTTFCITLPARSSAKKTSPALPVITS
jgi:signal transduction histidine kinase